MHSSRPYSVGCRVVAALALFAAAAILPGCSRALRPVVPVQPLSRVTITPAADTLIAGGTRVFSAVAYDTLGNPVPGMAIAWDSADPTIAFVNANGLVTALNEGLARIVARAGDKADTATVYITGVAAGWVLQPSGTVRDLYGVYFGADGRRGFVVGASGTLLTTVDAGASWSTGNSNTPADLHSICFTSADTGWAAGSGGALMKTVNGGVSWVRQMNLASTANLTCVRFSDSRHGWVVGSGGLIARTRDGGANWTITIPFGWQLNSVSFTDSLNGWLAGANGIVMGSHDGGASWYDVPLSVSSQTFKGIARVDDSISVAVGTQGTVARTQATVDSLAWSVGSVGASEALEGVFMVSPTTGWAVGSNPGGLVLMTTDGGETWTPQAAGVAQALHAVLFVDPLRGWAVGSGGRILHTTHAGKP
jgi:photosystem II stability/assembly factor-like uncharacterized protein